MVQPKKPQQPSPETTSICDRCLGKGKTLEPSPDSKGWDSVEMLPCSKCRGTGKGPTLH